MSSRGIQSWSALQLIGLVAFCTSASSALRPSGECPSDDVGEDTSALSLLQTSIKMHSDVTPAADLRSRGVATIVFRHHAKREIFNATRQSLEFGTVSNAIVQAQPKKLTNPVARSVIYVGFACFALLGILDWYRFCSLPAAGGAAALLGAAGASGEHQKENAGKDKALADLPEWSIPGLVALTSYRFYTGFLSATWLPYLLAMEGADLYSESQSLFMGLAKLIYGLTILTNPLFGLLGDRAVALSHGIGRRLFLRAGIVIAGLGILVCVLADTYRFFFCFVFGILLWRIGEALNDVTTEALVPELVPQSQYAVASAVKATSFLLGGVSAYVMLIFMTEYHYTWLYYAYGVGMLVFAIPCQVLLSDDLPMKGKLERQTGPFHELMRKAYIVPCSIKGYFPQLCLAICVFGFGTATMFFQLLAIRDLVGVRDVKQLQDTFSFSSVVFFVSAAVAAVSGTLLDRRRMNAQNGSTTPQTAETAIKDPAILIDRLHSVVKVGVAYAAISFLLPAIYLLQDHTTRVCVFYAYAVMLGCAFGSGFARFQDITWQLIPPDVDVANAMGFNIMCRLFGVGIGNFMAGGLLEFFTFPEVPNASASWYHHINYNTGVHLQSSPVYKPMGYLAMCTVCAMACLASSRICWSIACGVQRDMKDARVPVPAA